MRVAILSVMGQGGAGTNATRAGENLLDELRRALGGSSDVTASVWLLDDGSGASPSAWQALSSDGFESLHVLTLRGFHGRDRAFSAALGYLTCEREETFDGYVLVESNRPAEARNLAALLETALHHPEAVVTCPGSGSAFHPLVRALTGATLDRHPLLLLPPRAAEALAHCPHSGLFLEAAMEKLALPRVEAPSAKPAEGGAGSALRDTLAASAVLRDRVFARVTAGFAAAFVLAVFGGIALAALRLPSVPAWLLASVFGASTLVTLLLGLNSRALEETRLWTPALDSALLVAGVKRVKRGPYAVTASGG